MRLNALIILSILGFNCFAQKAVFSESPLSAVGAYDVLKRVFEKANIVIESYPPGILVEMASELR